MTAEIEKLVNVIEAVLKHRDSILIRVHLSVADEDNCRYIKQLGGKRVGDLSGPSLRRLPQTALQAPTKAGSYLVRVCPLDEDASTWDWHDWRPCP